MNKNKRAAGRRGGMSRSPEKLAAARENLRLAHAAQPPTGGTSGRWAVQLPIPPEERAAYLDAARESGSSVGEWILDAMRGRLDAEKA